MSSFSQFGQVPTLSSSQLLASGTKPGSSSPLESNVPRPSSHGLATSALQAAGQSAAAYSAAQAAQYSSLLAYPRLAGLAAADGVSAGVYSAAATMSQAGLYPAIGAADPTAFYVNPLTGTPYDLKDNAEIWRSLSQPMAGFYDPTGMGYPYGYGGMDLSLAARRKNATKENTGTLKAWLNEHKKNPYPTKGEKIMLAIITKMTLTQVSTWFANARRRLKKENKMTWSPRNKGEDSDEDEDGETTNAKDENDNSHNELDKDQQRTGSDQEDNLDILGDHSQNVDVTSCDSDDDDIQVTLRNNASGLADSSSMLGVNRLMEGSNSLYNKDGVKTVGINGDSAKSSSPTTSPGGGDSQAPARPKIWSLADVLASGPGTSTTNVSSSDSRPGAPHSGGGLNYPMPLKPSSLGYSPTASGIMNRHWGDRAPYQLSAVPGLSPPYSGSIPSSTLASSLVSTGLSTSVPRPGLGMMGMPGASFPLRPTLATPGQPLAVATPTSTTSADMARLHQSTELRVATSQRAELPSPPGQNNQAPLTAFKPVARSKLPEHIRA